MPETPGLANADGSFPAGVPAPVGGCLLTGWASRRMGRDKARLPWRGATMVEWTANEIRATVGSATLAEAPDRYGDLGRRGFGEAFPAASR